MSSIDLAGLLLRVAVGILFLAHAWLKYKVFTPKGTADYFQSLGVPRFLGPFSIVIEMLGGAALILGVGTRVVALLLIPQMLGTIVLVHGKKGFWFTNEGGGWEYPALWIVCLLAIALVGSGAAALWPIWG
jgi:putative oxidoreductase